MCLKIRLNCYDDFFEQNLFYEKQNTTLMLIEIPNSFDNVLMTIT